jgi:hypothetical protein
MISEDSIADSGDEQVVCNALLLALVATQLRVAWHAGAVSAERAMEILDQQSRRVPEGQARRAPYRRVQATLCASASMFSGDETGYGIAADSGSVSAGAKGKCERGIEHFATCPVWATARLGRDS